MKIKFNKNYLGHDFLSINNENLPDNYDCKICGVKIFFEILQNKYVFADYTKHGFKKLNLTCDEMIIKNLLE